ncbi:MAG: tRNA (N(6)-L-threonylcarbamoyladenosine(37)-C(2))-methylthiotransferase [Methanoregula sp.]|nr:tRNA (N(6)-L-threonylcarbamoyladenosine(37)-C(2))-methylthiotransferase [Methanoregula sp.]
MIVAGTENSDECAIDTGWWEPLAGKRIYIETYGCRYNFGDTANLVEVLKQKGSILVDTVNEADAVIINTCTVVGATERRMLRRLAHLQDKNLYVTGCMPMVQREAIFAICTPTIIPPDTIRATYRGVGTVACGGVGIVQIAQGCLGRCSYCITRTARGPLASFPAAEIVKKIGAFIRAGTPEIQLTAQDASAWGRDTGSNLPELLAEIGGLPGHFRIRVGMMNPATVKGILAPLVDAYASDHIFRFVHLPVQAGSNRILQRMGRGYTVADFETIVAAFRKKYPGITISTDMIVGFPGETDEDFSRSNELIERLRPNKVNVTRYSMRPFTGPFAEKDFPDSVKKERSRILNAHAEKIYAEINAPCLNRVVPFVVTESLRSGSVLARTPSYTGVVINEDLPWGYAGQAVLKKDRKYFFIGERVS